MSRRTCRMFTPPISRMFPKALTPSRSFRSLARKGFDLILGTSFGYMDPMATVAEEFPDQTFIHVSGYKSNNKNFGNLFGAMEDMKYLAGMVAGSRAKTDGNPEDSVTWPPSRSRRNCAWAMPSAGYAKKTCPECTHGCALDQYLARSCC